MTTTTTTTTTVETPMTDTDFTYQLTVAADAARVFAAIVDVRGWWSGRIDGRADQAGAEFRYRYADLHDSTQRVTTLEPGRRVVWRVLDARLRRVLGLREQEPQLGDRGREAEVRAHRPGLGRDDGGAADRVHERRLRASHDCDPGRPGAARRGRRDIHLHGRRLLRRDLHRQGDRRRVPHHRRRRLRRRLAPWEP